MMCDENRKIKEEDVEPNLYRAQVDIFLGF
jgi:hypothetical protein